MLAAVDKAMPAYACGAAACEMSLSTHVRSAVSRLTAVRCTYGIITVTAT